ncbi:MAG: phenylalanine--tRNA ligase subunit beta [Candidatus Eisenbacteria bacterium]
MRLPYGWLQEFVKLDVTPEEVCAYLIMLGFADAEVIANEWDCLDNFIVGRATKVGKHPDQPHLKIVEVNVGYTSLTSVCGAPNVDEGVLYAIAMPGARLGSGRTVDAAPIAGVNSECVLCSGWEAWLDDSKDELLAIDSEVAPGIKLIEALGLDEPVIELEVTPNRSDCLGLIGIARELAAVFGKELIIPEPGLSEDGSPIADLATVEVVDTEACPRYGAIALEDVEVRGSSAEVRARLRLAGLRPISNVVDTTNMVLFETGHPLHAFDLDKLAGAGIVVRRAGSGEKIVALDANEYELSPDDLVIADKEKPIAIAGVIGGRNSEVGALTKRVLIEGAFFDPPSIWKTSKRLGIQTEASYRFARTVDIGAVLYVLARTAALIQQNTKCHVSRGMIDVYPEPVAPRHLFVNPKRINRLLGTSVPEQEICDYLERLGFLVSPGKDLEVVVPTRRCDVEFEADIAEEVARLYGYDRIEGTTTTTCQTYGKLPLEAQIAGLARNTLTGMGLTEIVSDAMAGPASMDLYNIPAETLVEIRNPVGIQNSILRGSLVPGIVTALVKNERFGQEVVALFELGRVYFKKGGEFGEALRLTIGLSGATQPRAWYAEARGFDFYDLKGILEALAASFDLELSFTDGGYDFLHPGRRAVVSLNQGDAGLPIGSMGELAAPVSDATGARRLIYVAEIDFEHLIAPASRPRKYQDIQKYPAVKRDIAVIVPQSVVDSKIRAVILAEGGSLVESVETFDIYEGEQIPEGTKSLAYGIVFRSPARTLTEQEIDGLQKRMEERLFSEFGGKIRMKE